MPNSVTIATQMKGGKPAANMFEAFIDAKITSKFWFSSFMGKLKPAHTVIWTQEKYQVSTKVIVKKIMANALIQIEWGEPSRAVPWTLDLKHSI